MITAIQSMICAKGTEISSNGQLPMRRKMMAIICVTVFILPDHAAAMTTPSLAATDRRDL